MSSPQSPQPDSASTHSINPMSLSAAELARMLSAAGGKRVTPEQIQADIDRGAPANSGGHINLIHYAAWLNRQLRAR